MDFVRAGVGLPSLWNDLRQQIFLGNEAFVTYMQAEVSLEQPLDEIPRMQRRVIAKPLTVIPVGTRGRCSPWHGVGLPNWRLHNEGDCR